MHPALITLYMLLMVIALIGIIYRMIKNTDKLKQRIWVLEGEYLTLLQENVTLRKRIDEIPSTAKLTEK